MRVSRKNNGKSLHSRWTKLKYVPKQAAAFFSKAQFINLACGRGSGKTELARRKLILSLAMKKPHAKPLYFYAMPTYGQAKRVAWKELMDLLPKSWIDTINVQDLYVKTIFGSELYVMGMDQPQRLEGVQIDGIVVDEACDHKPGSFALSIMPTLTHRKAWCWRIGVPKRVGTCSREFKEAFDRGLVSEPDSDIQSYSWPSSDVLTPEQLALFRREMDPKDFEEQFNASWVQAGGLIFYTFDRTVHINEQITQYRPHLPLYIGMDFNVDPMAWVVGQIIEDHPICPGQKILTVLDELFIRNTNTPECLKVLYERFEHHKERVYFCGDAASRQRRSNASLSDYMHIYNFNKWPDKRICIPKSNPAIANRFSVTNSVLKNADEQIRCYIHPRCKRLALDLEYRAYKEGSAEPNDSGDDGHITDAIGYLMWSQFPMTLNQKTSPSVLIKSF